MEHFSKLLEALSSILWPLILIGVLYFLRDAIKSVILSAKGRKFTLKIGGNELTMEEVTEQQRHLIADLQTKISDLQTVVEQISHQPLNNGILESNQQTPIQRLLWVDDRPRNNSFLVASLEELGIKVDIAKSTKEAMNLFSPKRYDRIISDMGRPESDHAGIELTELIRKQDKEIPIYIFCGSWAAKNLKKASTDAGVNGITSSGTSLLKMLKIQRDG